MLRLPSRHAPRFRYVRYSVLAASVWLAPLGGTAPSAAAASTADPPADLVLLHGQIHTEDAGRTVAQALAVRGNTIVAVGSDQAMSARIGPNTRTVELAGRVVLPGIIDAHTHPAESAQDFGKCNLGDEMLAPPQIKARVAGCLKQHPVDRTLWFDVVQVNPSELTLTLADLDSMLADHPMLLSGSDGHTVWANTAALKAAGIDVATQDPAGGRIEHDKAGNPTGTLRDTAAEIAQRAEPSPACSFRRRNSIKPLRRCAPPGSHRYKTPLPMTMTCSSTNGSTMRSG